MHILGVMDIFDLTIPLPTSFGIGIGTAMAWHGRRFVLE